MTTLIQNPTRSKCYSMEPTTKGDLPVPKALYPTTYHPEQRFHRNYAPPTSSFASAAMSYAVNALSIPEASREWTDGAQSGTTGTSLVIGFWSPSRLFRPEVEP